MIAPRLEIRGLTRAFSGKPVVDDVSLTVAPGQVTCLLGPSGCGKSTTLRMIAGIERPDRGEVLIDGTLMESGHYHVPPEGRSVGLMFQDFALFPHLSVAQNVGFGLRNRKSDAARRIDMLLERVSLQGFGTMRPHELSGGEQQRVALARALAPSPRVMLMDEPFSGLDNRLRDGIRDDTLDVLKSEGTAVLLVTHEPDEAMRMGDEIALMRGGRIVQRGAPYNVYNAPNDKAAAAFFSDINVIRGTSLGALTRTPFGDFLTPGQVDGAEVDIVIRPQHVKIDLDRGGRGPNPTAGDGTAARATVIRSRFLGRDSLVEFQIDGSALRMTASVPNVFLPKTGTVLWLMIRRDRCYVFPASDGVGSGPRGANRAL